MLELASDAGLSELPDVPSLALGTGLVSPLDLTAAYTMFPGGGEVVRAARDASACSTPTAARSSTQPIERERVHQRGGRVSDGEHAARCRSIAGPARRRATLGVRGPVGGKTGTTDDYHDAWFVGFSTSVVVGVWVGFDQPASIGREAYGARVALPIWADFMKRTARAAAGAEFAVPEGLHAEELCSVSYLRPVETVRCTRSTSRRATRCRPTLCPIHRGTLKQRAARAVEGLFRSLGRQDRAGSFAEK